MTSALETTRRGSAIMFAQRPHPSVQAASGQMDGELVSTIDSTQLQIAQTAFRRSEERLDLYRKIFENISDGIFITDGRHKIVAVNPAFTEITGYTFADVSEQHIGMLKADRTSFAQYRATWRVVRKIGTWQGEVWIRTKTGEERPQQISISVICNDRGVATNYVAVFSDITERKEKDERNFFLSQHDPLTGLPNRQLFNNRLNQALASAARHGERVALLFLDLNRFKVINDSLGHRVGDLLLCSVAERLKSVVREEDTVARLGGDEFVFIIPHIDRLETSANVAQKIIWAMAEPHDIEGHRFTIGGSIGISIYPSDADDSEKLVRNADSAMYKAKDRGGNCYEFYTSNMTCRAVERMALENSLRKGLAHNEFVIFYQPKVSLTSGRIVGAEALLRWFHPDLGIVPPEKFIPVAEETGLIEEIGEWVLLDACLQNKRWQQLGLTPIPISVNLSARQCKQELASSVRRTLSESKLDADYLELELTENILMTDQAAVLHELRSIGVQFSIDDFGTGYSNLSYLKRFPIDMLKIDKSFMFNVQIGDYKTEIADAVISLAHSLHLRVTAEGVNAAWQARHLRERGCDWAQGYYFSRPVPAHKFANLLRRGTTARLGPGYVL